MADENEKIAVTIGLINQKGGIGKTTTTAALASSLGSRGFSVLAVDTDAQRNLSSQFNVGKLIRERGSRGSIAEVLLEEVAARDAILATEYKNVYLLPSSARVATVEMTLPGFEDGTVRLSNAMDDVKNLFDVIIFDGTPNLGKLAANIINASQWLLIPVQGIWALSGVDTIIDMAKKNCKTYKQPMPHLGIILTKIRKTNVYKELRLEAIRRFPDYVFESEIRDSVKAEEAAMAQMPVPIYTSDSSIALDYEMLTNELISKIGLQASN